MRLLIRLSGVMNRLLLIPVNNSDILWTYLLQIIDFMFRKFPSALPVMVFSIRENLLAVFSPYYSASKKYTAIGVYRRLQEFGR